MHVLSFDIGSGGITAARMDESLTAGAVAETRWDLHRDAAGRATLAAADIETAFKEAAAGIQGAEPAAAVSIGCFMHSLLVVNSAGAAMTPVFTWLDTTSRENIQRVRSRIGDGFYERTGCHYHPMFPVFKLPSLSVSPGCRVISAKAMLVHALTGVYVDDYGMAAASGLFNMHSCGWDEQIADAAGITPENLPDLTNPYEVVGRVTARGAERFGIAEGTAVVNGSGDGFLANVGSGCDLPNRIAITLGTSASVRQMVAEPVLEPRAGAFCYRASSDAFLLGCASSNGGNTVDWARKLFAAIEPAPSGVAIPIFLPWLNGERSFEWNPDMRASWSGIGSEHTNRELLRAVIEGVVFNVIQYTDVIQKLSGVDAEQVVLSGNLFLDSTIAPLIASLVPAKVLRPPLIGQATLRGAAVYGWRALGHDAKGALESLLANAQTVERMNDNALRERYERFKQARASKLPTVRK